MRGFIAGGVIVVILLIVGSFFFGCERIDAGHAGVKVELYGSDRGVQDVELVTGMVWYNRITTALPTFVKSSINR